MPYGNVLTEQIPRQNMNEILKVSAVGEPQIHGNVLIVLLVYVNSSPNFRGGTKNIKL